MASVEVVINNRTYAIACDPGEEERVRHLGGMVNERAGRLGTAASEAQRLLMVSLMLADELEEAQSRKTANGHAEPVAHETDEERDLLIAAVEHLAERIDHIAAGLSQP